MKLTELYFRLRPALMIAIDIIVPVLIMGAIGKLVGKFELALAVGFGLGLISYFRHWASKDTQPTDFTWFFPKKSVEVRANEETEKK